MDTDSKTIEKDSFCYIHTDTKSALKCFKCGKTICARCVKYVFGCNYCEACANSAKISVGSVIYSKDSLKYYENKANKTAIKKMSFKYAFRVLIIIFIIAGISKRNSVASWIYDRIPKLGIKEGKMTPIKNIIELSGIKIKDTKEIPNQFFVKTQLILFAKKIELDIKMNEGYPVDLTGYLRANFETKIEGKDIAIDPWGTEYKMKKMTEGYVISSAGPDKAFDTEDDIGQNFK